MEQMQFSYVPQKVVEQMISVFPEKICAIFHFLVQNLDLETNKLAKFLENSMYEILLYTVYAQQMFDIPITDEVGLK